MTELPDMELCRSRFEQYMVKEYIHSNTSLAFARNEHRYFDSEVEMAWKAFKAGFEFAKGEKMSEQKIEAFWRDATAEDIAKVMRGEKVEARFAISECDWSGKEWVLLNANDEQLRLIGWHEGFWVDSDGDHFKQCQVYDPPKDSGGDWEPTKEEVQYAMDRCGVPTARLVHRPEVGDTVVFPGGLHVIANEKGFTVI